MLAKIITLVVFSGLAIALILGFRAQSLRSDRIQSVDDRYRGRVPPIMPSRLATQAELDATLIKVAAANDLQRVKELLVRGANINAQDHRGDTALVWTLDDAQSYGFDVANYLLDQGADVNVMPNNGGQTALGRSAGVSLPIMRRILERGAHVNAQNSSVAPALWYAAAANDVEGVKLLLRWGADPTLHSESSPFTILRIAERTGAREAAVLIRAAIAEWNKKMKRKGKKST